MLSLGRPIPDLVVFDQDGRIDTLVEVKFGVSRNNLWLHQTVLNGTENRVDDAVDPVLRLEALELRRESVDRQAGALNGGRFRILDSPRPDHRSASPGAA